MACLTNKLFSFISLSRIFNTLGAIFNIVFVIICLQHASPKFAIAVANLSIGSDLLYHFVIKQIRPASSLADSFRLYKPTLYTCCHHDSLQLSYHNLFTVVCFMNILSDIIISVVYKCQF